MFDDVFNVSLLAVLHTVNDLIVLCNSDPDPCKDISSDRDTD